MADARDRDVIRLPPEQARRLREMAERREREGAGSKASADRNTLTLKLPAKQAHRLHVLMNALAREARDAEERKFCADLRDYLDAAIRLRMAERKLGD
jgi:hypothetical protein